MYWGAGKGGALRDDPQPAPTCRGHHDVSQRGGHREKGKPAARAMVIENVPLRVEEVIEKLHL